MYKRQKWIGFIPILSTIGSRIGLKIRIAGVVSRTIPTISRKMFITIRSTISFVNVIILIIRILLSYVFNDAHFVKNLTTFDNDIITHKDVYKRQSSRNRNNCR